MKKYILGLIIAGVIVSCSDYKYPQDAKISEQSGALVDSSASYLLHELTFDGTAYSVLWNKEMLCQLNSYYRTTNEPILYNYYIGYNIYRLVIAEQRKEPLVLSINKDGNRAWLVSKRITKQQDANMDSIADPSILTPSFDHFTRELTDQEWVNFETLWQAADFYHQTNNQVDKPFDSFFLIEAHQKGKYWYVFRSFDDSPLKEVVTYVRGLTRF